MTSSQDQQPEPEPEPEPELEPEPEPVCIVMWGVRGEGRARCLKSGRKV